MTTFSDAIKRYIGFDDDDARNLRGLWEVVKPVLPSVVDRFYGAIRNDPEALRVFTGGEQQLDYLSGILGEWLEGLFNGRYDQTYFEQAARAGRTHVRHELPQHYMVAAMEIMWQQLDRRVRTAGAQDVDVKLASLHKLLMLQLALMLEAYKERYSELVRREEHNIVEERLTRAEHLAEIGQLAASLAHEIKNPLAGISGAIQIIREEMPEDDPHRPIISEILGQISRLDETVKDLLLYARPTPPKRSKFPLDQAVSRALSLLKGEPALQRVRVKFERGREDMTVHADLRQIEQLIVNLLINAAHASPDGAAVEITVAQDADFVTLAVCDRGKGMPADIQRRAFEPFFTTKAKGTGLGLSICRRIVEVHGGNISLQSVVGGGTTALVGLPRPASRELKDTIDDRTSSHR